MPCKEVRGIQYHYEDRGPQDARPVVCLHGFTASGATFEGQAVFLTTDARSRGRYRVITLDERGCGQSGKPEGGYEIHELAEDLKAFVGKVGLKKPPILVGWSIGGAIVMDYLIHHQDDVDKAVLVAGAVPRVTPDGPDFPWGLPEDQLNQIIAGLANGRSRMPTLRSITDLLFHADVGKPTKEWMFSISAQATWFVDQAFEDLTRRDYRQDFPKIRKVVGICHGRHDRLVPIEIGQFTAQNLPNKPPLVVFENSGHSPAIEEPELFNPSLLTFLDAPSPK